MHHGQLDTAIQELQQAVRLNPDWNEPYYSLAAAYKRKGDLKAANAALQSARQAGSVYSDKAYDTAAHTPE
jgi:Flp pilus assembly protein TadD